jgi:hypothetical protein
MLEEPAVGYYDQAKFKEAEEVALQQVELAKDMFRGKL